MARKPSTTGERQNIVGTEKIRAKYAPSPPELMPTQIMYVDLILGGGLPRGSMVEVASPSGLGKSTLMAHISRNLCAAGERVDWWDYEHCLTAGLRASIGLTPYENGLFHHLEPTTYGDAEEILEGISDADQPNLIVVDSEAAMLPDKLKDASILQMEPGIKARLSSNLLQKYKGWCRQRAITMVFINQMRTKMGDRFTQVTEDSAGGNALKFYCDIRLRMRRLADLTREENTPEGKKKVTYGVECALWAIKNKEARSHVELTLPIIFGKGVSGIQIFKNILVKAGCVEAAGSYFKISMPGVHEGNVQGNKGLYAFLKERRPDVEKFIKDQGLLVLSTEIE